MLVAKYQNMEKPSEKAWITVLCACFCWFLSIAVLWLYQNARNLLEMSTYFFCFGYTVKPV